MQHIISPTNATFMHACYGKRVIVIMKVQKNLIVEEENKMNWEPYY